LNNLGEVYFYLGELDKSKQYYEEALSLSQKSKDVQQTGISHVLLGWLYTDKGEYLRAREQFEKAFDLWGKAGTKYYQAYSSLRLAWVNSELGEIEKAESFLDQTLRYAVEARDKMLIACVDVGKGMVSRVQKNWEKSIEYFEKSLQEFEAMNARRWHVYILAKLVLVEYARVYLEKGQEGDRGKARNLLNDALEIFKKMGAQKDIEKVEAKIAFIETGKIVSEPKLIGYVSTGYAGLDKLLCGGLPANYAVVLTSPSCDERDILVKSFLKTGAEKGEVTFYVTIDPGTSTAFVEEFPSSFYLFVCNPQADAIVKSSPNVFKLKGVENLTDISMALTSAIRKLDPSLKGRRRICLDLVSDVLLQHHAVQTRRCLSSLIPELRSEGFTLLAVMDPEMHSPQEARAVLDLFDGEINIFEKPTEKGSERYLRIKRMSDQKYLDNEILLTKRA
jgi:tetratricopeptide (TPR) repeat protein